MELKPERIESAAEAIYKASLCSTPWETLPKSLKSTFLEFAEAALATIPETGALTEEEHTILRVVANNIKANGDANPTAQILYSIANRLAPRSATGRPTPAPEPAAPTVELVPGMGIEECVNCGNSISVGTNNKEWVHEDSDQMECEVAAPTGNPVAGTSVFPSEKRDADFEVPQATVTKQERVEELLHRHTVSRAKKVAAEIDAIYKPVLNIISTATRQLAEARKLIKDYRKDHSDDASGWSIERGPCDMESDDEGIMDHRCSMCKVADDEMLINAPQGKEPHD
jgi:hypothetical protein